MPAPVTHSNYVSWRSYASLFRDHAVMVSISSGQSRGQDGWVGEGSALVDDDG